MSLRGRESTCTRVQGGVGRRKKKLKAKENSRHHKDCKVCKDILDVGCSGRRNGSSTDRRNFTSTNHK